MTKEEKQADNKAYYQANKETIKASGKVYYKANKKQWKGYGKAWRKANPEKIKTKNEAYYQANKKIVNARSKAYRKANPQKMKEQIKAWNEANPEKRRDAVNKRRALKYKTQIEPINEKEIYLRDGWKCQICHQRVDKKLKYPDPKSASLDHIIPLSQGGSHTYRNLQLAHLGCNSSKNVNVLPEGEQLRLF